MSDIVIKGMEMPKGCWWYDDALNFRECKLAKVCPYHLTIGLYGNEYPDAEKSEDCPLVELPPHGRLIDADKLLPESGYEPMMFKPKYGGDHRTQYNTLMGYEILGIVEDAPTILEASKE